VELVATKMTAPDDPASHDEHVAATAHQRGERRHDVGVADSAEVRRTQDEISAAEES
jgi:hypothetical protein